MKTLTIGLSRVRLMLRERSNVFFVFIFPIAIILLIGAQFGGGFDPVAGVLAGDEGALSQALVAEIEAIEDLDVRSFEDRDLLIQAVERGEAQVGVLIPEGLDEVAESGSTVEIGFLARPDGFGAQLQSIVSAAVAEVMRPVGAAQFASSETGESFDVALAVARGPELQGPGLTVTVSAVGDALFPPTLGRFDLGASQQLVLFVFLTALAGSSGVILARQLGISRRMLSTPTSMRSVVAGESFGRWAVAMVQGVYIMVLTIVLFSVDWGDPLGAALILVTLSAVGAGAGVLLGSVMDNEQQAGGISVMLSIGLAALGGAMLPIELFSPAMQTIAHLTPHAWAIDAFAELVRRGGTTADILPELGVLTLYAVVLLGLASWRLRVAITRP